MNNNCKIAGEKEHKEQAKNQIPLFTIIPASEKAKDYILQQSKTIDNLQEIISKLQEENKDLKTKLSKYEVIEE